VFIPSGATVCGAVNAKLAVPVRSVYRRVLLKLPPTSEKTVTVAFVTAVELKVTNAVIVEASSESTALGSAVTSRDRILGSTVMYVWPCPSAYSLLLAMIVTVALSWSSVIGA